MCIFEEVLVEDLPTLGRKKIPGPGRTWGPKQDEPKDAHTEMYWNSMDKLKRKAQSCKKQGGSSESHIKGTPKGHELISQQQHCTPERSGGKCVERKEPAPWCP